MAGGSGTGGRTSQIHQMRVRRLREPSVQLTVSLAEGALRNLPHEESVVMQSVLPY